MDLNIRMPRAFAPLEERVKALVGAAVSRGKVDVYIGVEHLNGECVRLSLNREYLEGYLAVLGQVGKEYGHIRRSHAGYGRRPQRGVSRTQGGGGRGKSAGR